MSSSVQQQRGGCGAFPRNQTSTNHCECLEREGARNLSSSDMNMNSTLIHFLCSSVVFQSCTECSPPMLLSNGCCAAAHQRIHRSRPPHVCPECGGTAEPPLFQSHLDETCLHFARRIGYRCDVLLMLVFG